MTTYVEYVDGLEALVVAGVTRRYTSGVPLSLSTADLPAQWVQLPDGESEATIFGDPSGSRWPTFGADLIIAIEAVGQSTGGANFDATVVLMEALRTRLGLTTSLTESPLSWAMRQAIVTVAKNDYWAIFCSISGQG